MFIEKEIKLQVPEKVSSIIPQLKQLATANYLGESQLKNTYFDTPSLALSKQRVALRIRQIEQRYIQTLKAKGTSNKGLHSRQEWEWDIPSHELDLLKLQQLEDFDLSDAVGEEGELMQAIFTTHFTRKVWLLPLSDGEDEIEVAFDQGFVAAASAKGKTLQSSICELELELKRGKEECLHQCAAALMQAIPDLEIYDISKAQRGYQLYNQLTSEQD